MSIKKKNKKTKKKRKNKIINNLCVHEKSVDEVAKKKTEKIFVNRHP